MFKPIELFIGLRYTRAKRRNHFISFISMTSMLGIALGVMALITVLSVMNGFEEELRSRILGMAAHGTISASGRGLDNWQEIIKQVRAHETVEGAAPYIRGEVMITHGKQVAGVVLRGILPQQEPAVSDFDKVMKKGELTSLVAGKYGIIMGKELAWTLGVDVGDRVTIVSPQSIVTPAGGLPRLRRFIVTGLFEAGMYEYDRGVVLTHMADAARLFRMQDQVTGIRLRFDNMFDAPAIVRNIANEMQGYYRISDWTQQHTNFFRAIKTEKQVMFVILALIVAVAAFNIVSTLVMVVTDKQSDIAILRTLGLSPRSVMGVFLVQGIIIGLVGTLLGVLSGIALANNVETLVPAIERFFGVQFLPPDVYYISQLPSQLEMTDVGSIAVVSLVLSFLATLYPAWSAARTHPVEALRYE
ncbi:MAG: lipoprotein-releasing ABC transporter permease subunit [Gammaproteobacteria bacterium]|nr:lipoprotein-releasing ABC transporter permease subunit [Gammaproteobacteria bacterium]